jgi:hypothetical protein
MNQAERIWWGKLSFSLPGALITYLMQTYVGLSELSSFLMGVVIYLLFSNIISRMMRVEGFKGLKIGVGAYFFTWITLWVILYTYFRL